MGKGRALTIKEFAARYEITEFQAAAILRDLRKGNYPRIPADALDAFLKSKSI